MELHVLCRSQEKANAGGVVLGQHIVPKGFIQDSPALGQLVGIVLGSGAVAPVRDFTRHDGNQGVLHQLQLHLLILGNSVHAQIQAGQGRNHVGVGVINLKAPNLVDGERHPIGPAAILDVCLRPSWAVTHAGQFVQVHPPLAILCGKYGVAWHILQHRVKVIQIGEEQVSELPVVRPRLQEIEQVERNRVAGDVVVAYDF